MSSYQAKIGWKMQRKRENKNYRSVPCLPDLLEKIPKKKQKNFKELKNTNMASFQTKIGWKRLRRRDNKNYRSISFLCDA